MKNFSRKIFFIFFATTFFSNTIFFANENNFDNDKNFIIESTSHVNWVTKNFTSKINLDADKANIPLPSGKLTAMNQIYSRLPDLIKDPLLTLNVDSSKKLGDSILEKEISYPMIQENISSKNCSLGYFKTDTNFFSMDYLLELPKISSLLIHHTNPYKLKKGIEIVSSKKYSGIIIDARGKLPVHGEFLKEEIQPCFFPRIFTEEMNLIFEKNMVDSNLAKKGNVCHYDYSDNDERYANIVGKNPLHILAQKSFGENRSDIVIKTQDALKIISIPENLDLLKNGKIVILLDKENLIYDVSAPKKDALYYTTLQNIKFYPIRELLGPDRIEDGPNGIRFLYNLKFIPDSPELLPEEKNRIAECAKLLTEAIKTNEFTIFVGGHTADIGQPENQMTLSIARTQTIIKELVQQGLPENIFTYRGFGATVPATGGDNKTEEGKAVNRRVEITLRPKVTYIQRKN